MPFHRFLAPEYSDGIENVRLSVTGGLLQSARFISLVVHGDRSEDSQVTMMLPTWGQFIDHDLTSTAQPKAIDGKVPSCCKPDELHPACMPIVVPDDDPWLSPLGVKCLEFLRSAPASRRDCTLSWREQTNQASSYLDASMIYNSNPRLSENSRLFRDGLLIFGKSSAADACKAGGVHSGCVKAGDTRSGEQPGLLAMHTVFVSEHNRIAISLSALNPHWSDEKIYQESRRIIGAMIQHITYREFLPLVLGREVTQLFDLELLPTGYYSGYDPKTNPTIANSFSAAAFRFGHSMVQKTLMRADKNHNFIRNNVSLHDEHDLGDMGGPGSLHRLLRGLANQRADKRDEFMSAELTNHLFQSSPFPFGLDLAAINIQRSRDHGIAPYVLWRQPCGLSLVKNWTDMIPIVGPESTRRLKRAYNSVDDIDLFVAGLAERPVSGGLVGPTFACIIAQQFSNLRRGDRFWYENYGFESSFTPAQLESIRRTSLAQILCRTLETGTLQPHVFLPSTFLLNERKPCGFGELGPVDLEPWTEQDPFHKTNEHLTDVKVKPMTDKPLLESPFSNSDNEVSNKLDLDAVDKFKIGQSQKQKSTMKPTILRPVKVKKTKPTVNTKLDFKSTKQGNRRRRTKRRNSTTRTTTRPTTTTTTAGWFLADEFAWVQLGDRDEPGSKDMTEGRDQRDETQDQTGQHETNTQDKDQNYPTKRQKQDKKDKRDGRDRPVAFQNNRPVFDKSDEDTRRPTQQDPNIQYWMKFISTIRPPTSISYDIEVPLVSTSTKRIRPTDQLYKKTTNKPTETISTDRFYSQTSDPMTFFMTSTYRPENALPQPDMAVQHTFHSSVGQVNTWPDSFSLISVSSPSTFPSTVKIQSRRNKTTPRTTKPTTKPTTTTTTMTPEIDPDDIYYFNDRDWERIDSDQPPSDHVKYFYIDNVLHKVEPHGVYRKRPTKRYIDAVPFIKNIVGYLDSQEQDKIGPMTDVITHDDDKIHWIRRLDDDVERRDFDMPLTSRKIDKRPIPVAFVPLTVLTNVERKDNWLHVEAKSMTSLPRVPELKVDGDVSKEIPRPIQVF